LVGERERERGVRENPRRELQNNVYSKKPPSEKERERERESERETKRER